MDAVEAAIDIMLDPDAANHEAPGIVEVHDDGCPARAGGPCGCSLGYQLLVPPSGVAQFLMWLERLDFHIRSGFE